MRNFINIREEFLKDFVVKFDSEFNPISAGQFCDEIQYLSKKDSDRDIEVHISSPGGQVYSLLQMIDVINSVPNDIVTICNSFAASCGQVLLLSGTVGKRYATPNSNILLHQVSSGASGHVEDIQISYEQTQRLNKRLMGIVAERTGHSIKKILKDAARDKWFSAEEALDYGLIDKIMEPKYKK